MNETHPRRQLGRSLLALLAGMLAGAILSIGTDVLLHVIGLFPALGQPISSPPLLLATVYRSVYGVISSYIAARLAPNSPMTHALVLGIVGFVVSIVGAVVTWNKGPAFGPHWYPVALIVLALPTAWVGGKLRMMQLPGAPFKRSLSGVFDLIRVIRVHPWLLCLLPFSYPRRESKDLLFLICHPERSEA